MKLLRPQGQIIKVKFFQPLSKLSENWTLVKRITHFGRIHGKLFMLSCPQGQIIDVKCEKKFYSLLDFSENWWLRTWVTHLERIHKKFSCYPPTRSNYWHKMQRNHNKSANLNFFSAIIEIVPELVISNMGNKFGRDTWKTVHGQIIDIKCEKSQ